MKKLILFRHAKSDWSVAGQKDFDRGLNDRGQRDAPRMSVLLKDIQPKVDAVVCSTAVRTRLTCDYILEQIQVAPERVHYRDELYQASARILFNEICGLDSDWEVVLMVGHNPGISHIAEYLTKSEVGEVPTSGIVIIDFDCDDWTEISEGTGKMVAYRYPKEGEDAV